MVFQPHGPIPTGIHCGKTMFGHFCNSHGMMTLGLNDTVLVVVIGRAKNGSCRGGRTHRLDNLALVVKEASCGGDSKVFADFTGVRNVGVATLVEFSGCGLPMWEERRVEWVGQNGVLSSRHSAVVSDGNKARKSAAIVIGGAKENHI